jgi:hypothetical protein
MAKKEIVTCDNCGAGVPEEKERFRLGTRLYDVCERCMKGEIVLEGAPKHWPKWVPAVSVVDWLKFQDRKDQGQRVVTRERISEVNTNLEAEILNLPTDDPTKLIREVTKIQNRVRRLHIRETGSM